MKYVKWAIKSLLFGVVFLFLFNLIGRYINLNIPFNVWSLLIVGTLRIPGAVILIILQLL